MKLDSIREFADLDRRLREVDEAAEATLANVLDVEARLTRVKQDARPSRTQGAGTDAPEPAG